MKLGVSDVEGLRVSEISGCFKVGEGVGGSEIGGCFKMGEGVAGVRGVLRVFMIRGEGNGCKGRQMVRYDYL